MEQEQGRAAPSADHLLLTARCPLLHLPTCPRKGCTPPFTEGETEARTSALTPGQKQGLLLTRCPLLIRLPPTVQAGPPSPV